jgi:hypothetical protein
MLIRLTDALSNCYPIWIYRMHLYSHDASNYQPRVRIKSGEKWNGITTLVD